MVEADATPLGHHNEVTAIPFFSADRFQYWVIDFERHEFEVVMTDGTRHTEALPPTTLRDNQVARSVFDWKSWWVWSTTVRGDIFPSEAYSRVSTDKGRPAIYLDQNHWSTLAWARVDPSKVKDQDELAAAQRIIALALDAGIVLPLSSAHLTETSPLYGDRRYHLGLAMAQLSGGWQLRSPLTVWVNELAAMLAAYEHVPVPPSTQLPVVTLEPQAWSANDVHAHEIDNDLELLQLVLTEPSVILSTLIDTTPLEKGDASAWVKRNREITELFATECLTDAERTRRAEGLFWCENIQELERAAALVGVDASRFAQDASALVQQLRATPYLSILSALFQRRHLDRNARWKESDFFDMMYLSCGTAYCDYVAAETYTGTQLQQILRQQGKQGNTFLSLTELVTALNRDGVKTASEKAALDDL
ncbi:hypothetical protein [Glycomyces albidus]|uniref:Uncharacterized protein n=1 Tax=Glycomyces albidus TaxID=2656774 RepID=A0A6L5GEA7_9ACTN|nr:hypothetical protein [Glycomyces albidus]MQM27916.1 hypothetical protein [Glycomyces albidus]